MSTYRVDTSPSIIRELDKCIMCRRCEMMCNDVQTVYALNAFGRGFNAAVAPAFEQNLDKSPCTFCGQCVAVCPTGALTEVDHTPRLIRIVRSNKNGYRSNGSRNSRCVGRGVRYETRNHCNRQNGDRVEGDWF